MTTETQTKTYTREEKLNFFKDELNLIQDKDIREFTEAMLDKLPIYFFTTLAAKRATHHQTLQEQKVDSLSTQYQQLI